MRDFGVIRANFGENPEAAAPYINVARTQLGILKNLMVMGSLQQLTRTVFMQDGTKITVASVFGQDTVKIVVAPKQPNAAPLQPAAALHITNSNTWTAASVVSSSTTPVTYDPSIGGMYSIEYPGTVTTYNNDGTTNTSVDPSPLPLASTKVAKPVVGGVISTDQTTWLNLATGVPAAFLPTADAPCNFSVGGGTDGVRFTANASGIQFSKADQHNSPATDAPDYVYPSDSGAVNKYDVLIQAQNDSASVVQDNTVNVKYFYNVQHVHNTVINGWVTYSSYDGTTVFGTSPSTPTYAALTASCAAQAATMNAASADFLGGGSGLGYGYGPYDYPVIGPLSSTVSGTTTSWYVPAYYNQWYWYIKCSGTYFVGWSYMSSGWQTGSDGITYGVGTYIETTSSSCPPDQITLSDQATYGEDAFGVGSTSPAYELNGVWHAGAYTGYDYTFTKKSDSASCEKYTSSMSGGVLTENFTLITTQQIYPLTQ